MSLIFKASLIIGISFGINKLLSLVRQYLIADQFGFTPQIDAFNVANNAPDLIFSLFSGGTLAMAFIPVFAQYLDVEGRDLSWKLFSKVAIFLFSITAVASLVIALIAPILVASQIGIAPGFNQAQQALVVKLLRINLLATLIFSISGLVMASLQAHKHFLLPAIAPIFYNLGIIFGILILSPATPITAAGLQLPHFDMGVFGLAYGVVLGALLHLLIQIPGIIHYQFRFSFSIDLRDEGIRKILRLMGPRILTALLIQTTFLLRDNFASRLESGSVTALTYGYYIMQVPETLIGTSIAIALLPTLSTYISQQKKEEFARLLTASIRVLIAASTITTVLIFVLLAKVIDIVFHFSPQENQVLIWTAQAFTAGLLAHTLLELFVRAFYARQIPTIPLYATLVRTIVFIILGAIFYKSSGAVGIAAIDSFSIAIEAMILFIFLLPLIHQKIKIIHTIGRSILGSVVGLAIIWAVFSYLHVPMLIQISIGITFAVAAYLVFVIKEVKLLIKL